MRQKFCQGSVVVIGHVMVIGRFALAGLNKFRQEIENRLKQRIKVFIE